MTYETDTRYTSPRAARVLLVAALCLLSVAVHAGSAGAAVQIESFTTTSSDTQAGGHPDLTTSFVLEDPGAPEAARHVIFNAPEGVFGNPEAIPQCTSFDFALQQCPTNSQAGVITVYANYESDPHYLLGTAPIYDMEVSSEETANFAFNVPILGIPINIPVAVRTAGDYGLRFTVSNISQLTPLAEAKMTFWGFPAHADNDDERFPKGSLGKPAGCPNLATTSCIGSTPASVSVHPLIDNPTTCPGSPLVTSLEVQSYQTPGQRSNAQGSYPAATGCEKVVFKPVLFSRPTTTEADSATGLDIELRDPLFFGFAASPSQIRSSTVTLPEGLTINPDAADGQTACTDDQANFDSEGPDECPDSAKIGTFQIGSPALDGNLEGALYIGEPVPGNQYRLFMIANGFGIHAKLVGKFLPDPDTGQVTAYFEDLPQVPFDNFSVHLFASDRGLVATPIRCTVYTTVAEFVPWNASLPTTKSTQNFTINSGPNATPCPGQIRPFKPRLEAGTSSSGAGAFSSFFLKLDRDDGDQFLGDLNFKMPPGFTGSLRGIVYCSDAAIAAAAQTLGRTEQATPSCPANSQVGTTNVAAGPGAHPFHAVGKMYLGGPFKGAPLSLAAITPALAGPYDYGTVVVRVALQVDPQTAQVSAFSDTVPSIVGGVPIRMRSIQVNIDKPNFTINPTNCSPFTVDSEGIGDEGTIAAFSSFFHVDDCSVLGFKPKMTFRQIGGRKATRRAANPGLKIDLRTRPGDANIKSLSVTLSKAFEIDQRHLGNICSEKELDTTQCAGRQPIGKAMTTTPLLDQPLAGPVYAVSGSGGLPRLAFILNGQVNLIPRADTNTVGGRLKTTVLVVPDAPIGHFALTIFGGKAGYLINTRDICKSHPPIRIDYVAQSGKTLMQKIPVQAAACKGKAHGRRSRDSR